MSFQRKASGSFRLIADGKQGCAWNMALDEALLEDSANWLRFYAWEEPCVSLGYFQKPEAFADLPEELPLLRRMTGGGAILHAKELTFSLAVSEDRLPARTADSYSCVHDAVREVLSDLGIRLRTAAKKQRGAESSRWCFATAHAPDLVQEDGRKILGSAQRRRHGRVLLHASLILERHPLCPFTGALADHGLPDQQQLTQGLARSIARALLFKNTTDPGSLPGTVLKRAAELEKNRYHNAHWTRTR